VEGVLEETGATLEGALALVEAIDVAGTRSGLPVLDGSEEAVRIEGTGSVVLLDATGIEIALVFAHETRKSAAVTQATPPTNTAPPRCPRRMNVCENRS